jgi:hypothetical protein
MKDAKARLRRKKVYSFLDVGRVPVTNEHGNVVNHEIAPEPKTLAGYIARELSVQQAKTAAKEKERHDARVKAYWGQQPASALMNSPVGVRDDFSGLEIGQSVPNAGLDFLAELEKEGVTLTLPAKQRSGKYIESQNKHLGAAVTVANLRRAFQRLKELGCFAEGEVIEPRPEPVEASVERPTRMTLADALKQADGTQASDQRIRAAATRDFIFGEAKPMIDQWVEHLYREYDYIPTEQQRLEFFMPPDGYMHAHGLSFLDPRSYDRLRKWAVATGRFRADMVSAEEACSDLLKKGLIPFAQYQYLETDLTRRGLWNRSRRHADALNLIPRF